ncbi:hypothetical protein BOH78_3947, partial [Pichia kudriavzevii]
HRKEACDYVGVCVVGNYKNFRIDKLSNYFR